MLFGVADGHQDHFSALGIGGEDFVLSLHLREVKDARDRTQVNALGCKRINPGETIVAEGIQQVLDIG